MDNDVSNLIRWQKRTFWMRLILLSLILLALLVVGYRAGGNPCDRCKFNDPVYGELSCRELIDDYAEPYLKPANSKNPKEISVPNITFYP